MKTKKTTFAFLTIICLFNVNLSADTKKIPICINSGNTFFPASEKSYNSDKEDGTLICWLEERNNGSVYIQKINSTGRLIWNVNGLIVDSNIETGFSVDSDYPVLFSDNEGGAIIIYRKYSPGKEEIYMQKVFADGKVLRKPVCLSCYYNGYNFSPRAVLTTDREIVVTWENFYNGDFNIHAQKISLSGIKRWNRGREIVVCDNEYDQRKPAITCDNSNNVNIIWLDSRNNQSLSFDLFANKIDENGNAFSFGREGKLIFNKEADRSNLRNSVISDNNELRKAEFYNHNLISSDNNSFITAIQNSYDERHSSIKVIKVNQRLDVEWEHDFNSHSYSSNPLIVRSKDNNANIFWNEVNDNQNNICGSGIDANRNFIWGSSNGLNISYDKLKETFNRVLPSVYNRNGIYYEDNKIFLSWVTEHNNNLFLKELNLTDESKQSNNITEIENGVSGGEYTSITTLMNKLVVVYCHSNNIYAYIRKIDDNEFIKGRQRPIISNFPNPFNPSTKISFSIPSDGFVRLSVFDITGRIIRTLINEFRISGNYEETFDGSNIATGVYFYRLETNGDVTTKKMTLIK